MASTLVFISICSFCIIFTKLVVLSVISHLVISIISLVIVILLKNLFTISLFVEKKEFLHPSSIILFISLFSSFISLINSSNRNVVLVNFCSIEYISAISLVALSFNVICFFICSLYFSKILSFSKNLNHIKKCNIYLLKSLLSMITSNKIL